MAALVEELTCKDPARRPSDASEVARRAGRLRETLVGTAAATPPTAPTAALATTAVFATKPAPTRTLTGPPPPRTGGRPGSGRARPVAIVGAGLVALGLLGLLLAGILRSGGTPPRPAGAPTSSTTTPPTPTPTPPATVAEVNVEAAALVGQPVDRVRQQLQQLGLQVQVRWQPSDQQESDTVLSIQPTGQVQVGSVITLTGAQRPHGKGHSGGGDTG